MKIVTDEVSGRKLIVDEDYWTDYGENADEYFSRFNILSNLYAIRNRASISEVIDFANKVRKAGGGNIIDSLMPSTPEQSDSCLIANALNFDCSIEPQINDIWFMIVDDVIIGEKIAQELGLKYQVYDETGEFSSTVNIVLPKEIGLVAKAFDTYMDYELETYNINTEIQDIV